MNDFQELWDRLTCTALYLRVVHESSENRGSGVDEQARLYISAIRCRNSSSIVLTPDLDGTFYKDLTLRIIFPHDNY